MNHGPNNNFDKNEVRPVRGEILRVKKPGKYVIHRVKSKNTILPNIKFTMSHTFLLEVQKNYISFWKKLTQFIQTLSLQCPTPFGWKYKKTT